SISEITGRGRVDTDRTVALLEAWAEWRGSVRRVLLAHMQPRCTLGRMVRLARQGGELGEHNEATEPELPDDLMAQVDRIVCRLGAQHKRVVVIEYVELRMAPQGRKAKRVGVSKRHYRRLLAEAHEAVSEAVDWRNILIA